MSNRRLTMEELQADERGIFSVKPDKKSSWRAKISAAKRNHEQLSAAAVELAKVKYRLTMRKTNSEAVVFRDGQNPDGSTRWRKKHSGLAAGWLDYTILLPPNGHAIFVDTKTGAESKKKKQGLNEKQQEFIADVKAAGCSVIVLTSLDQFERELAAVISAYGFPAPH